MVWGEGGLGAESEDSSPGPAERHPARRDEEWKRGWTEMHKWCTCGHQTPDTRQHEMRICSLGLVDCFLPRGQEGHAKVHDDEGSQ